MGSFIVLEGGDGTGKSTQAASLSERLLRAGHSIILLREPGGTPVGDQIRRILKGERGPGLSPMAELLLFSAARTELVAHALKPALGSGHTVICDRYTPSTIAYQGYGRGLPLDVIRKVNHLATQGQEPDLVVLLDMEPAEALRRVAEGSEPDRIGEEDLRRFEEEPLEFHQRVRQGYLELAKAEPERWLVVDSSLPKERVAEIIWRRVGALLEGSP